MIGVEMNLTDISIGYSYVKGGGDCLNFLCSKCMLIAGDSNYSDGMYGMFFNNKADAINFLNMLNDFIVAAKQAGFCHKKTK